MCVAISTSVQGQTTIDFEEFALAPNTYWYDQSSSADTFFLSQNVRFPHQYSGYWVSGWTYSNVSDSVTSGYTNLGAVAAGSGFSSSSNYAVGQQNAIIKNRKVEDFQATGMYVCNGTYAAKSMETGDLFAKKFGGATGDDQDFFLLTVKGYHQGVEKTDSVNFYLADFRFADSSQDYIVKDWTWVDLSALGFVDSLKFILSSSDNGQFGMNTPAFFCIDNFVYDGIVSVGQKIQDDLAIYPNPSNGDFYLSIPPEVLEFQIRCFNSSGQLVELDANDRVSEVAHFRIFEPGVYYIQLNYENEQQTKKVVIY